MPTTQQYPTATGSVDSWVLAAGASKPAAVSGNDGDGTYIRSFGASEQQRFVFASLPTDIATITTCTMRARFRNSMAGTGFSWIFNGSGNVNTGTHTGVTSYTLESLAHFSLVVATINASEGGCMAGNAGAVELRCTELYRDTDYIQAGGCLISIMSIVASMIGPGLTLAEMAKLSTTMGRIAVDGSSFFRLKPSEYVEALRQWREYTHPRYFLLGAA